MHKFPIAVDSESHAEYGISSWADAEGEGEELCRNKKKQIEFLQDQIRSQLNSVKDKIFKENPNREHVLETYGILASQIKEQERKREEEKRKKGKQKQISLMQQENEQEILRLKKENEEEIERLKHQNEMRIQMLREEAWNVGLKPNAATQTKQGHHSGRQKPMESQKAEEHKKSKTSRQEKPPVCDKCGAMTKQLEEEKKKTRLTQLATPSPIQKEKDRPDNCMLCKFQRYSKTIANSLLDRYGLNNA